MGLLYVMPVEEQEVDRIAKTDQKIILKSYGLPLVFWGYLLSILTVIGIMYLAILTPLEKLYAGEDQLNKALAVIVFLTLIITPIILIGFFFYEKRIEKSKEIIILKYLVFGIKFWQKKIVLRDPQAIEINHYLDSPNMARLEGHKDMRGFQNKGYFILSAIDINGSSIEIDRHSRKADLNKLTNLLTQY